VISGKILRSTVGEVGEFKLDKEGTRARGCVCAFAGGGRGGCWVLTEAEGFYGESTSEPCYSTMRWRCSEVQRWALRLDKPQPPHTHIRVPKLPHEQSSSVRELEKHHPNQRPWPYRYHNGGRECDAYSRQGGLSSSRRTGRAITL
jgi:hypothetical protein